MTPRKLALIALLPATISAASAAERDDFVLHCAGCHKMDGAGSDVVPALDEVGTVYNRAGGREYLASVPGVAQAPLSDQRLADLLNWLIADQSAVVVDPPYTAPEVRRLRRFPLREPILARQRLFESNPSSPEAP